MPARWPGVNARTQGVLKSESKEQGKQEGYCLRELTRLLEEKDPEKTWAHLQRMLLAEGRSVWVCAGCLQKVKANKDASYDALRDLCVPADVKACRVEEERRPRSR